MIKVKEYRGHIRNWEALCEELKIDPSLAREEREEAILIKAFETWRYDMADHMHGMFAICLILVYFSCFLMFINISLQLVKPFYKLVAMGLSTAYGIQLFLCIGGVIKLIPHTGVTMPLISYGGSSVLSTIIIFAVIQGLYLLRQREVYILENRQNEGTEEECSQNKY